MMNSPSKNQLPKRPSFLLPPSLTLSAVYHCQPRLPKMVESGTALLPPVRLNAEDVAAVIVSLGENKWLAEERDLEIVRNGLTCMTGAHHCSGTVVHWHAKYPWAEDPRTMPNNRSRCRCNISQRNSCQRIQSGRGLIASPWNGHAQGCSVVKRSVGEQDRTSLVYKPPHRAKSTFRLHPNWDVLISSQRYKGLSLNDMLSKGPDVLNFIRAVLLRFWSGLFAALGDVWKMYNSVWLEDQEVYMHRFLWRDYEDGDIEDYSIKS